MDSTATFLILSMTAAIAFSSPTTNEVYHIKHSQNYNECPRQPCLMLNEFTENLTQLSCFPKLELIFQQGNHSLDKALVFSCSQQYSNNSLSIHSYESSSVNIICETSDARFEIHNLANANISGLSFIGCSGNKIVSVGNLIFEDMAFIHANGNKSTLTMAHSTALIYRTKFYSTTCAEATSNCTMTSLNSLHHSKVAILRNSDVTFLSCKFNQQSIYVGKTATMHSNLDYDAHTFNKVSITITDSKFINSSSIYGGAVYAFEATVNLKRSWFSNVSATKRGGAIYANKSVVTITESQFDDNMAGGYGGVIAAVDSNLHISNSSFINNRARRKYGGVAYIVSTSVKVYGCLFDSNTAEIFGGVIYARKCFPFVINESSFSNNKVLTRIGGNALRLYNTIDARICNSTFSDTILSINHQDNTSALDSMADGTRKEALYITDSTALLQSVTLSGCCVSLYSYNSNVTLSGNTTFTNILNRKPGGTGALTAFMSIIFVKGYCSFNRNLAANGGAIHATESKVYVIGDLTIANNMATESGGGLYLYRSELNHMRESQLEISGNHAITKGGGVHAISSSIIAIYNNQGSDNEEKTLTFTNNRATKGGAIYLEANAKLYVIKKGLRYTQQIQTYAIKFIQNYADFGGAIYVDDDFNSAACNRPYNITHSDASECFFQVLTFATKSVNKSMQLQTIYLEKNRAQTNLNGHVLHGGLLDRCTISPSAQVQRYRHKNFSSGIQYFYSVTSIENSTELQMLVSSSPVRVCFCRDEEPDCSFELPPYHVKSGERFKVSLVVVDQVGHTVAANIHTLLASKQSELGIGQRVLKTSQNCTEMSFDISSPNDYETLHLYPIGPCNDAPSSKREIKVYFKSCICPIGFEQSINTIKCMCKCDSKLERYTTNCDPRTQSIKRQGNYWIGYIATNNSNTSGYLIYPNCPFGYCLPSSSQVSINLNDVNGSNSQCIEGRSGLLCGSCRQGYGLSLTTSSCLPCAGIWPAKAVGISLLAFAAGVLLVAIILILNLTVAVGTINGLIFYANVVSSAHFNFAGIRFIVAWLNLDFGFEVCFVNGLDAYWKTWLQLAFPLYLLVLVLTVIAISKQSTRFSNLIGKRNPVATLATIILLSYTRLLQTIIASLSFTVLHYPGNRQVHVWLPDATVRYLHGKHIPLFIVAVVILLAGIAYTSLLFSWQWLLVHQDKTLLRWVGNQRLVQFLEPYHAAYKFSHRYWTGLLLFVRIILYIASATNISGDLAVNLLAITIMISGLLFLKGTFTTMIYRKRFPNVIETACYLNIILLCAINFYTLRSHYSEAQKTLTHVSGDLIFILFITVAMYHTCTEILFKLKWWRSMTIHLKQWKVTKKVMHCVGNQLNKRDLNQPPEENDNASVHSEELHSDYTRYRETLLNTTH